MSASKKYLIVIGGATATGKTAFSIEIARHFKAEILSADSRQFYREMSIGTAKPTAEELAAAPHHFINSLHISEDYSAGDFEKDALVLLEAIFQKNKMAVLTGGSGLFIKAVCEGLDHFPEIPEAVKGAVARLYDSGGIAALQEELRQADPGYFARVDLNNPQRLMRALAVCRATGRPFSSFQNREKMRRNFEPVYLQIGVERNLLYERINRRVDEMMGAGLLEEVKKLYPYRRLNALQTVGYQELFEHLEGRISLEEAIGKIKQNTRRYAKRQLTWLRKDPRWVISSPNELEEVIRFIEDRVNGK